MKKLRKKQRKREQLKVLKLKETKVQTVWEMVCEMVLQISCLILAVMMQLLWSSCRVSESSCRVQVEELEKEEERKVQKKKKEDRKRNGRCRRKRKRTERLVYSCV